MLVSGTGPEIVDLWSSETLRVGEENREVEILSCWMSWMRGTHLYSLLSLLTLINTQPHSQCTGTDHWLHTSSSARQPIADTKNVPAAVCRDGRPPKNQTSRDNYWHFLRKNLNRPHMSTLFPHFSNGRQLEILRTAFTNIVLRSQNFVKPKLIVEPIC